MVRKYVHLLDDYFAIRISPIDREAQSATSDQNVLAQASLLILSGPFRNMQVSGFAIRQGDKRRYVTGPSHWWINPDSPADAHARVDQTNNTKRKKKNSGRVEFFRPADDGLSGIPHDVQDVFLGAYDAYLQAVTAA